MFCFFLVDMLKFDTSAADQIIYVCLCVYICSYKYIIIADSLNCLYVPFEFPLVLIEVEVVTSDLLETPRLES